MITGIKQETVNPVAVHIGRRIRALRRVRGMKQDALARDVGYSSHSAIAQFENGIAVPSVDKAIEIARVLGVGIGVLLGDEGSPGDPAVGSIDDMTLAQQSWLECWVSSRPKKDVKVVKDFLSGLLDKLDMACRRAVN